MTVAIIGPLETHRSAIEVIRVLLKEHGLEVALIESGDSSKPAFQDSIKKRDVFNSGYSFSDTRHLSSRSNESPPNKSSLTSQLLQEQYDDRLLEAVIAINNCTQIEPMLNTIYAIPETIPKLLVTNTPQNHGPCAADYPGIVILHSLTDLSSVNRFNLTFLRQTAKILYTLIHNPTTENDSSDTDHNPPVIAVTTSEITATCTRHAQSILEQADYEVALFDANGIGGQAMEALIRKGHIAGVLDLTTTELGNDILGGQASAGPDRMTAAATHSIPQVICPGGLDMVNFGPHYRVPHFHRQRTFYSANSGHTLMRTSAEENDQIGLDIAQKASASKGPTTILLPLQGISELDQKGNPFWDPESDRVLYESIRCNIIPAIDVVALDNHINDTLFAQIATKHLMDMVSVN